MVDDERLQTAIRHLREDKHDADAWEILYRSLYPFVLGSFFRMLGGNRYLAEECVQELMMRLLRNFRFEKDDVTIASLMMYVKQTVRSVTVDLIRRERTTVEGMDLLESAEFGLDEYSAAIFLESREDLALKARLEQAFRILPTRDASIIMFLAEGRSMDELANMLNVSKKTACNLASESRKRFREILFPARELLHKRAYV